MKINYKISKLKNGLRVLSVPQENTDVVTSLLLVGTGSHYEEEDTAGLSHFLEHLFFKGSKKHPSALEISTILDGIGAEYNAFTSKELTGFYIKSVADKAEVGLDVMGDYLKQPLFKPAEVNRERGVILEELHMRSDIPQQHVATAFIKALYGDQPAGRKTGGTEKSVNNIKTKDIKEYFNSQYKAGNMLAVFAGGISHNKAKNLARKYFGNLPGGEGYEKEPVKAPDKNAPKLVFEERKTDQTHLALGFQGVDMQDERRYPLSVLSVILGGGMSSRLFSEIREKRGLAYYVQAGTDEGSDYGYFVARAGVANKKLPQATRALVGELNKIKKETVGKKELEKAKHNIEGNTLIDLETSDSVAAELGAQDLLTRNIVTPEEYLENIKKVTAKDIKKVANEVFTQDTLRLAIVGPKQNQKELEKILGKI